MKQAYTIFDLECCALPEAQLISRMPEFDAPANLKDPAKILAAIAEKKRKWLDDAALDALTGTILCIGIRTGSGEGVLAGEETVILESFFKHLESRKEETGGACSFIGYNSHSFDLPYILRRSWLLGVPVPSWIRNGRYWHSCFVDLREIWQCGDRQASTGGLDGLARAMGLGSKTGSGKDFGRLWNEDREAAAAYCLNDLLLTEKIAARMGVIRNAPHELPQREQE